MQKKKKNLIRDCRTWRREQCQHHLPKEIKSHQFIILYSAKMANEVRGALTEKGGT